MKWRIWILSLGITFACLFVFSFAATQVYYKSSIDDSKEYLRVYMNSFDETLNLDDLNEQKRRRLFGKIERRKGYVYGRAG